MTIYTGKMLKTLAVKWCMRQKKQINDNQLMLLYTQTKHYGPKCKVVHETEETDE